MTQLTRSALRQILTGHWPLLLRMLAPLLLGATLISIIVTTLWFGGKRESLAAYAEANLLRFALKYSTKPAHTGSNIVVISVKDTDLASLERAPDHSLNDVHIKEYAATLERVALSQPKLIVVTWLGNAHPLTEDYLRPLTDTIDRLGISKSTILAVHLFAAGNVPEAISRRYQVAEARDCYYEINSFCTWNPAWTWMPQRLADAFWNHRPEWAISTNLPHTLPNFVLNLPDVTTLKTFSFLDFRPPISTELAKASIVFIGNDATQDIQFRNNKDLLQKTFIPTSDPERSLLTDGIPFHVFWAGMAHMFTQGETVSVVPSSLCLLALCFVCGLVIWSIYVLRGQALGPFLIGAVALPLLNALSVYHLKIYMPVVPLIAAGIVIFIAATFLSIAAFSYRKWRSIAAQAAAEQTADIKENFISLISHNLNTPVAQLRGLLNLLIHKQDQQTENLESANTSLEYMRLIVQTVLKTTSLGQNPSKLTSHTVRQIWQYSLDQWGSTLDRLQIRLEVAPSEDDELRGEVWFYRYALDISTFSDTVLFVILWGHIKFSARSFKVLLDPSNPEPGDPQGLIVRITASPEPEDSKFEFSTDFALAAIERYLIAAFDCRGIQCRLGDDQLTLTFPDFKPPTPGQSD